MVMVVVIGDGSIGAGCCGGDVLVVVMGGGEGGCEVVLLVVVVQVCHAQTGRRAGTVGG